MRMKICLLALLLGCNVTAEILHEIVKERTTVSLRCPHSVSGDTTWSRETDGNKFDILTVAGDGEIKHISDPGRRYSSVADKSLAIRGVTTSDSGRYFCNNEAAVELTVIPSGTIRRDATEGTRVTLTCPHDFGGSGPTWSRDSGDIQQQKGFYVSPVDNTLTNTAVELGHSGLYYCGGKPAVYLNVIKGTSTPKTAPTTKAATTTSSTASPTPTKKQTSAAPTSTAAAPTLKNTGDKKSPTTTTTTTTTTAATTIATATAATAIATATDAVNNGEHAPPLALLSGIISFFLLVIIIIIIYCARRRRFKRQVSLSGGDERCPVYAEIQDVFVLQPTNGGQSMATYCMAEFPVAGSNKNDPTYSTIPDLPPVEKKTDSCLPDDSHYSLIGDTITGGNQKGSSQLSDNTYVLLEKPKAPGNNMYQ